MIKADMLAKQIRLLADTFHAEGFKDISDKLHEIAREFEGKINSWKST